MNRIPYYKDKIAEINKEIEDLKERIAVKISLRENYIAELQSMCPHPEYALKQVTVGSDEPLQKDLKYNICYLCNLQM